MLGTQFEVLDSAWEDMDEVKIGDEVCFLFTADGKVASVVRCNATNRSTAVGIAQTNGVEVFLPNGGMILIPGKFSGSKNLTGRLVELRARDDDGDLEVTDISSAGHVGGFDPSAMTIGKYQVSAGVRIFDQSKNSLYAPVDLSDLAGSIISAEDIQTIHRNTSGYVDCIVLNDVTGKHYQYGMCRLIETEEDRCLTLENGGSSDITMIPTPISFRDGQFSGVAMGGDGKIKSIVKLEELSGLSPADFFDSQGSTYLEHAGKVYPVSSDVVCYKSANKLWITEESGSARLAVCRAFSSELSAYYDPYVGQIRVVCAN